MRRCPALESGLRCDLLAPWSQLSQLRGSPGSIPVRFLRELTVRETAGRSTFVSSQPAIRDSAHPPWKRTRLSAGGDGKHPGFGALFEQLRIEDEALTGRAEADGHSRDQEGVAAAAQRGPQTSALCGRYRLGPPNRWGGLLVEYAGQCAPESCQRASERTPTEGDGADVTADAVDRRRKGKG